MGSFSITAPGTQGIIQLSSTNGVAFAGQAYLAVGAPYTIAAQSPSFGGCPGFFKVTKMVFSWEGGSGRFILKNDPATGAVLTYCTFQSSVVDTRRTTYTWIPTIQGDTEHVNFILGSWFGSPTDVIDVTVFYDTGVQETASFTVNMQMPSMTMNFAYETDASTRYAFGPFVYYHIVEGQPHFDYTRITDWTDTNYLNGQTGYNYCLGSVGGVLSPDRISGVGDNTTNSDGVFYMIQKGNVRSQWTEVYDASSLSDIFTYTPSSPTDRGDNNYSLDQIDGNPGSYPWGWRGIVTNATAGSGELAVPPANSAPDQNNDNQSYYADNPGIFFNDVSTSPFTYTHFSNHYAFKTFFVWHPNGGIPIAVAGIDWNIDDDEDNPTARVTKSRLQSLSVPANWPRTASQTVGNVYGGPLYVTWDHRLQDLTGHGINVYIQRKPRSPSSAIPNQGPMGTGGQLGMINAAGLPNGLAANVGTMNTTL
jgi:hypothetical protein